MKVALLQHDRRVSFRFRRNVKKNLSLKLLNDK